MTDKLRQSDGDPESRIRHSLAADLKRLYRSPGPVPEAVDRAVLAEFKLRMGPRPYRRVLHRTVAAVAAIVLLCAVLSVLMRVRQPALDQPVVTDMYTVSMDLDHNGQVNVLDAFMLARDLKDRLEINAQWDVNNDGAVDQADVDYIAQAAVRIGGPKEVL